MRNFFRNILLPFIAGAIFGFVALSQGEMPDNNFAASFLGMCSKAWPCDQSLTVFEGLPVKRTGWLGVTFGTKCECPRRFLALPGKKFVRVHLTNGTCFPERGRSCAKGEPFHAESIASADRKLRGGNAAILRRYEHACRSTARVLKGADADTTILPSLCLECPLGNKARAHLLKRARKVFPGATFVDSVLTQHCLPGLVCERHGDRPYFPPGQDCVADTDGSDFLEVDVDAYAARANGCRAAYLHTPRFNLLAVTRKSFQPPLERTTRPTRADFEALRYWLLD